MQDTETGGHDESGGHQVNFGDYGIQLTRSFRANPVEDRRVDLMGQARAGP